MALIEIVKDAATKIVKEATFEEATRIAAELPVSVVNEDGTRTPFGEFAAPSAVETPDDEAPPPKVKPKKKIT